MRFLHDGLLRQNCCQLVSWNISSINHNWSNQQNLSNLCYISAKATYAAIARTYSFLTPDLWKETVFSKSPYQEHTDFLSKNHKPLASQRQEQRQYWAQWLFISRFRNFLVKLLKINWQKINLGFILMSFLIVRILQS